MMIICRVRLFAMLLLMACADVTFADGVWPTVGRPAIVVPGGVFDGDLDGDSNAFLAQGAERIPLTAVATGALYCGAGVSLQVPETIAPGIYDFVVTGSGAEVVQPGSVHVMATMAPTYTLAIVRGTTPTTEGQQIFTDEALAAIASGDPDLIFVVGTLSNDGSVQAYQALQNQFRSLTVPVVFSPDREEYFRGDYETVFGPAGYAFSFGGDGYLILGPDLAHGGSGTVERVGYVHRWRRALRSSRWSVGVAGRFGLDWSMRSQLVLFVDDPLDYLLVGEVPLGSGEKLPWGQTRFVVPPAAPVLPIQFVDVSEDALTVRGLPTEE